MYFIYCDESCHLEKDKSDVMVLGAIICNSAYKERVFEDIRALKQKHGISSWNELKWTKISSSKLDAYIELLNYFFCQPHLTFRAIVARNKSQLDHHSFNNSSYDDWYYKMYYQLLSPVTKFNKQYRIFIDIKDTQGGSKIRTLHSALRNKKGDHSNRIIKDIQLIRSHESEVMQLTDILIGALAFYHRGLHRLEHSSNSKKIVLQHIINYSGLDLSLSTRLSSEKINLFVWVPTSLRRE